MDARITAFGIELDSTSPQGFTDVPVEISHETGHVLVASDKSGHNGDNSASSIRFTYCVSHELDRQVLFLKVLVQDLSPLTVRFAQRQHSG